MLLDEGSFCIINPRDEEPHTEPDNEYKVHYQHGNVIHKTDSTSVAFVFRVSPHTCICNKSNNSVIFDSDTLSKVIDQDIHKNINKQKRKNLYSGINKEKYHAQIKNIFSDILKY